MNSEEIAITTNYSGWSKGLASNSTSASFTTRTPTTTLPATVAASTLVVPLDGTYLLLCPFGAGNDDTTFDFRVTIWSAWKNGQVVEYIPSWLGQWTATLSTATGSVDGLGTTNRMADTIAVSALAGSTPTVSSVLVCASNNIPGAFVKLDLESAALWIPTNEGLNRGLAQIDFDMTGATSGNVLYRWQN